MLLAPVGGTGELMTSPSDRPKPGSPSARPKTSLRLAIGPFSSDGSAFHELECTGEKLAESRTEGTRAIWNIRSQPSLYVVRKLYRLEGTPHFAVHALLFSVRDGRPKLARLEAYPEWEGLGKDHADLVQLAVSRGFRPRPQVEEPVAVGEETAQGRERLALHR